jgi:hypothetical protein
LVDLDVGAALYVGVRGGHGSRSDHHRPIKTRFERKRIG